MTSLAVSAQGTDLYISAQPATGPGVGSPTSWVKVSEVTSMSRDGDRAEIDVSSLDSEAREFRLGLQDNGSLSFEVLRVFDDAGQVLLVTALASINPYDFRIDYPDGSQQFFRALVKQVNDSAGIDDVIRANCQLRLSGPISLVVA